MPTVLYAEDRYPDDTIEREVFGDGITIMRRAVNSLADLSPEDCAKVDGLMILRFFVGREDMARFPNLKCIVRMGVGYDRIDRAAAAERNVQTFGIVGLGRIGTAAALRAKALGFRVMFYDPHLPNGSELAIGVARARTLEFLFYETELI